MKNLDDLNYIINDLIQESIYMDIPGRKKKAGSNVNCRCFICGDSATDANKMRGWFYTNNSPISYHCFNEGCTKKGIGLLAAMKSIEVSDAFKLVMLRQKDEGSYDEFDEFENTTKPTPKTEEAQKEDAIDIPKTWVDFTKNPNALNFLASRSILKAPYAITEQPYYYCNKAKKLVIPWSEYGEIKSYQYRTILPKDTSPKYQFKTGTDKPLYGSTKSMDPTLPFVFIHEGAFDSIFVPNSIACGSITPNASQVEKIENQFFEYEPILFMDNPWVDEATKKYIMKQAKKTPKAKIFFWPQQLKSKDVNDLVTQTKNVNVFNNPKFLKSRITTIQQASVCLCFGRDLKSKINKNKR